MSGNPLHPSIDLAPLAGWPESEIPESNLVFPYWPRFPVAQFNLEHAQYCGAPTFIQTIPEKVNPVGDVILNEKMKPIPVKGGESG